MKIENFNQINIGDTVTVRQFVSSDCTQEYTGVIVEKENGEIAIKTENGTNRELEIYALAMGEIIKRD
jgi:hypothetical protein